MYAHRAMTAYIHVVGTKTVPPLRELGVPGAAGNTTRHEKSGIREGQACHDIEAVFRNRIRPVGEVSLARELLACKGGG